MISGARKWAVLAVAVAAAGAVLSYFVWFDKPAQSAVSLNPNDADLVAIGKSVYGAQCAACHGVNLQGQPNWRERRPNGRLPAPPHDATGHTWHHPDRQLFDLTKFGPARLAGGGLESDMPGFEGTLSDREILAVLSYIKSTWPAEVRKRHDQINERYRRAMAK